MIETDLDVGIFSKEIRRNIRSQVCGTKSFTSGERASKRSILRACGQHHVKCPEVNTSPLRSGAK